MVIEVIGLPEKSVMYATDGSLLVRFTVIGPGPAFTSSVTVATTWSPPTTGLTSKEIDFGPMGRTVKVADLVEPPAVAVSVTATDVVIGEVLKMPLAVDAPSGMTPFGGGVTIGSLEV